MFADSICQMGPPQLPRAPLNWLNVLRSCSFCRCFFFSDPEDGEIRDAYGYHLKFYAAVFKDAGQLRRRFLRRGESTIAPHEILTEDGTLIFGAIYCSSDDARSYMQELRDVCDLPATFLHYDEDESRIEIPLVTAEEFAEDIEAPVAFVERHPTHERLEMTCSYGSTIFGPNE